MKVVLHVRRYTRDHDGMVRLGGRLVPLDAKKMLSPRHMHEGQDYREILLGVGQIDGPTEGRKG